ncbi:C/D box methylation guide ribonucleoprotein complex aNOP56 subunit [Candidatus Bathyarchaeota archaeon]|nr:C/D box methylation guide ribonucleoprotein complex aNOP56 subunit [Candidatus Bathyarchaeota archaeon]
MKITIIEWLIGVFAIDEENRVIDTVFFPRNREKMKDTIIRVQKGEVVEEVAKIVRNLVDKGYRSIIVENKNLAKSISEKFDVEVFIENPNQGGKYLRGNIGRLAIEKGYIKDLEEFHKIVHEITTLLSRKNIREKSSRRDLLTSQTILIIDDLDKTFNIFANRLKEWYGLHFPELSTLVNKNEKYLKLIASLGRRKNFTLEKLIKEGFTPEQCKNILSVAESSIGAKIEKKDILEIQNFANALLTLYNTRNNLESYLEEAIKEVAPHIHKLVGPTLGARLIAKVGGLGNLAKKSSSTIQVLGAEKALFRSLRTGAKPPKHGLIFQHNQVHQRPRWQRGKIARALASKLAIAARLDAYGGKYRGEELSKDFDERVKEIREKYAEPPSKRGNEKDED